MSQQGLVIDKQTEKVFVVEPEGWLTRSRLVELYLHTIGHVVLSWLLLETWMENIPTVQSKVC